MKFKEPTLHWYILLFGYQYPGNTTFKSVYSGSELKRITNMDITDAKEEGELPNDAMCMNVSYLGHMTRKELGI